jgi:hypothetical protein
VRPLREELQSEESFVRQAYKGSWGGTGGTPCFSEIVDI